MKTKTKFYALLLALGMLLLSLFGVGGIIRAHADEENWLYPYENYEFPEYVSDADYTANLDADLTSLYYFSDYEGCANYYNSGFIRRYMNMNPNITYSELHDWSSDFATSFGTYQQINNPFLIENALIIFEVRDNLPWQKGIYLSTDTEEQKYENYRTTIYWELERLFSIWQDRGCKIMFISGADEVWYHKYLDGFLDFVDIHINLDLITTFTYSVVDNLIENQRFGNSVMIFDGFTSRDSYFRGFFLPYVVDGLFTRGDAMKNFPSISKYEDYFKDYVVDGILTALNTIVYFYVERAYTDVFGNPVETSQVQEEFIDAGYACVIAGSNSYHDETQLGFDDAFLNYDGTLFSLYKHTEDADFYLYNNTWHSLGEIPEGVTYLGMTYSAVDKLLSVMMRDFILNDNAALAQYDNWSGRCAVTFRPMFGEVGWISVPKAFEVPLI